MALSNEDREMLIYYAIDKDDVTRWHNWDMALPEIQAEYPQLIRAMQAKEDAQTLFDAAVAKIVDDIE